MELKKRLDFRKVLVAAYSVAFIIYIIVGLQPVGAKEYEISGRVLIPEIGLDAEVTEIKLQNRRLETPEEIVGSFSKNKNKTLLIGHASTVFQDLVEIKAGDEIIYNEKKYIVSAREVLEKDEVGMSELLRGAEEDTLVIMTCFGEDLGNGDATERLIITATITSSDE